ncbi:MAG TPA: hypothetical protein EYG85_07840 [Crocinitomix sp.]|nr:hypothetical protein [Crocinitomix sp.]
MTTEKDNELTGVKFLDNIFFDPNINRYGIISMLLLVVGILAGIAVGAGAIHSTVQLAFLAVSTMAALSMILAVAPMKYIVYSSLIAVVIDIILILINLFT